uniref:Uncharacterized protein n=1 Tax=Vitis vinifera TaxID=29760 RepID=F6H7B4_VITVI
MCQIKPSSNSTHPHKTRSNPRFRVTIAADRDDQTGRLTTSLFGDSLVSIKGRSLASSPSSLSSSMSAVDRLMQEQRSRDAKKADATLVPTHVAMPLSFS